jgi:hypothetical protein
VRQLNRNGLLREGGRQCFVCESLGRHRVRIEHVDGKMLVSYRHMHVREIDLERGRTRLLEAERREANAATGSWQQTLIGRPQDTKTSFLKRGAAFNSCQVIDPRELAERQGFEPWVQLLTVQRFSKPPP